MNEPDKATSQSQLTEYGLAFKPMISRASVRAMIFMFAKHGNHTEIVDAKTSQELKHQFQSRGIDYNAMVDGCRDIKNTVPFFENLVGSRAFVDEGVRVSRVDREGNEDLVVEGPAEIVLLGFWAKFELAVESRDRAIEKSSFPEFQSAIVNGIASIEDYLSFRAEEWNKKNQSAQLTDSNADKIRFDDKIDNWIPHMLGGKIVDKSGAVWNDFKKLRTIRDNMAIHPKESRYSLSLKDLAATINLFRSGIAGLLIDLMIKFGDRIPRVIIRTKVAPDVIVVKKAA